MSEEVKSITSILPDNIQQIRELYQDINPENITDSLLAEIYTAARKSKSQSMTALATTLKWNIKKLNYYRDTYPDVATVIRMGFIDARADMEEKLTKTLYDSAIGNQITVDETIDEVDIYDFKTGLKTGTKKTKKTTTHQIPPNATAALELLKKLNPEEWNKSAQVQVNNNYVNQTLNVVDDVNIKVDYRNLSAEALTELLNSDTSTTDNKLINKREDGVSIDYLTEYRQQQNTKNETIESKPLRKRGRPKKKVEEQNNGTNN